ncbi:MULTISPECIES: response regulator [Polyangium]|uniref:Response regulator n=2 Tax=Polyangium TaxID=55 RepID=A0A4U1JCN3_9BACT|nr:MULTISPECIES: response regulator [Polyangium]MDI1432216.1 response regulator [Polyangium sorediatum]TKD06283.1 response regulator [Polyangium fumosum]
MRVLVCEDQDAIRRMIETLVGSSGHEVVGVATGAQAVERASTERFDILLLDLMLPGTLDGFEVCTRLRRDPSTKDLPIFVISAMDDPESRARVKEAGATAFYAKPFRPLELLKDIQAIAATIK